MAPGSNTQGAHSVARGKLTTPGPASRVVDIRLIPRPAAHARLRPISSIPPPPRSYPVGEGASTAVSPLRWGPRVRVLVAPSAELPGLRFGL
jgi:hypothetical protein